MLDALLGDGAVDRLGLAEAIRQRRRCCTRPRDARLPAVAGTTMAPTMLHGVGGPQRHARRAPASSSTAGSCPGTTEDEVLDGGAPHASATTSPTSCSSPSPPMHGNASVPERPAVGRRTPVRRRAARRRRCSRRCASGFTDSVYLRREFGTVAFGFSPFVATPAGVIEDGYHNRDERVHVDDIALSADVPRLRRAGAARLSATSVAAGAGTARSRAWARTTSTSAA